jgi:hypothetical protein
MKFKRNGTRKKGDSCAADAETDGPFILQHLLNASFMKSSVNMGYELKDQRSILGNGGVFSVHVTVNHNKFIYNKTN